MLCCGISSEKSVFKNKSAVIRTIASPPAQNHRSDLFPRHYTRTEITSIEMGGLKVVLFLPLPSMTTNDPIFPLREALKFSPDNIPLRQHIADMYQ
jgi:hypothetical protein